VPIHLKKIAQEEPFSENFLAKRYISVIIIHYYNVEVLTRKERGSDAY
jgi:hypothetical protein